MKSIESADFYENGVSFMIALWPRAMKDSAVKSAAQTIAGCRQKPHQTAKKSREIAIFKKSEITVRQEAETKTAATVSTFQEQCRIFQTFLSLHSTVYARLVSVLWLLFAAPPIKVTTGQ